MYRVEDLERANRMGSLTEWAALHGPPVMVSRYAFSFFFFINTPYTLYYIVYIYYLPQVLQGMPVHTRHTLWLRHWPLSHNNLANEALVVNC